LIGECGRRKGEKAGEVVAVEEGGEAEAAHDEHDEEEAEFPTLRGGKSSGSPHGRGSPFDGRRIAKQVPSMN
jgi:hypothetical protein